MGLDHWKISLLIIMGYIHYVIVNYDVSALKS